MNNLKVVIEHDFYSRKPININFRVSVKDRKNNLLHSYEFKNFSFDSGLYQANRIKQKFENPLFHLAILTAAIGKEADIKFDFNRGMDGFMEDLFEKSSNDFLEEYLKRTSNERDIKLIENEIKKRGELV